MDNFLLICFSALILLTAFKTISHRDPAYGALYLALTMVLLAGLFFIMGAPFLAGLQLIIYAGAVMVLFVMVLMLFDFKKTERNFKKSSLIWPVFLFGALGGVISLMALSSPPAAEDTSFFSARPIAFQLFTKYVLLFEVLGIALLVIALGAAALARLDKD